MTMERIIRMKQMECSCMELALEGERLCKSGDCRTGVDFFEAAVQAGTDDLETLSAIYSQLGNAYFYLQEYSKALEYHKLDLSLARTLSDRVGEAKASGNLGNTLKVLGKYEEAIACCLRHLDIARDLGDRVSEARALYNLGNVYHSQGKHTGRCSNEDPGHFPEEVKIALQKAAEYYEANLKIVKELGDKAAQGRACGNLGNTHYLLGDFPVAIQYHLQRLAIAKEFGDKAAERRAYSNLGNAHIFLLEFDTAADYYKKTLQIAKQLGDKALEAQSCYSLGNTYTLLQDYEKAIEYHMRHLKIAQELCDRVGEGRACWSLGNCHSSLGNNREAMEFASRHLQISKEVGDENGQFSAQMNMADLHNVLGMKHGSESAAGVLQPDGNLKDETDLAMSRRPFRRHSMENMELMKLTPDRKNMPEKNKATINGGARPKVPKFQKAASVAIDHFDPRRKTLTKEKSFDVEDDLFFDLVSKFQSRRIDDQRCSFNIPNASQNAAAIPKPNFLPVETKAKIQVPSPGADELLDMVAGIQSSRMNDQRADFPRFPGLNSPAVVDQILKEKTDVPDDKFFEMLMRCQGSRIEDQRSSLPSGIQPPPTLPDEDFFSLIQKVQSSRLEEQRTTLPPESSKSPTEMAGKKKKK